MSTNQVCVSTITPNYCQDNLNIENGTIYYNGCYSQLNANAYCISPLRVNNDEGSISITPEQHPQNIDGNTFYNLKKIYTFYPTPENTNCISNNYSTCNYNIANSNNNCNLYNCINNQLYPVPNNGSFYSESLSCNPSIIPSNNEPIPNVTTTNSFHTCIYNNQPIMVNCAKNQIMYYNLYDDAYTCSNTYTYANIINNKPICAPPPNYNGNNNLLVLYNYIQYSNDNQLSQESNIVCVYGNGLPTIESNVDNTCVYYNKKYWCTPLCPSSHPYPIYQHNAIGNLNSTIATEIRCTNQQLQNVKGDYLLNIVNY